MFGESGASTKIALVSNIDAATAPHLLVIKLECYFHEEKASFGPTLARETAADARTLDTDSFPLSIASSGMTRRTSQKSELFCKNCMNRPAACVIARDAMDARNY
jgi:hypothetical protein